MSRSPSRCGRLVALTLTAAAAPTTAWALHPALSVFIGCLETIVGLTVIAAALFGSERLSERAFRLLRWIADRSEPSTRCPR
ncbi:hypothetical protein [Nonomuraea jabiensis]|uniref:hypothetical protein n=1 Tax=Nonomuraea jabiensis TaxID=882448 RepID=UPI003D724F1B